jgi:hypothetical protein
MKKVLKEKLSLLFLGAGCAIWLTIGFSSCDIINPEEQIPSYIHLKEMVVEENPNVFHGSVQQRITNAQVYVNNEYLGVFPLPSTLPVLAEGTAELIVDPMIQLNGSRTTLGIYPFFERFTAEVDLVRAEVDTVQPTTIYKDGVLFELIEDFETGAQKFSDELDGNENTKVEVTTIDVFEGAFSGVIQLDADNPVVEVGTDLSDLFDLASAQGIFLEVHYKTDVNILFGLIGHDPFTQPISRYEYGLFPNDTWNKVYFNLTDLVRSSGFEGYQLSLIGALPLENGSFTLEEGKIYLDNVKLLRL